MSGFTVTGTDTGVGKTVVSTILAMGLNFKYWKPVQTGAEEGTDSDFVARWLGREKILPEAYVYPKPLSPHLASDGKEIVMSEISFDRSVPTIVEGAGGVLVPLNSNCLIIDLFKKIELPVIVVARTSLGTINHSLLSFEALRTRHIPIAGFITVGNENPASAKSIGEYGGVNHLGHVPICDLFCLSWFQAAFKNLTLPGDEYG